MLRLRPVRAAVHPALSRGLLGGIGDDQLRGATREHKGADHTLAALKSIRTARPGGYRLSIILDNLPASKTPAIRRSVKRESVELCFTPANASWPIRSRRNSTLSAPSS